MRKGVVLGVFAGAASAVIWAAISYSVNFEIGFVAWGVGALVGAAMGYGAATQANNGTGLVAVVIAVASILIGKYSAVQLDVRSTRPTTQQYVANYRNEIQNSDRKIIASIAGGIVHEKTLAGEELEFPEVEFAKDTVIGPEHFPKGIWDQAQAKWDSFDDQEKLAYRKKLIIRISQLYEQDLARYKQHQFARSFGLFDIVFFMLAMFTAYRLGSRNLATG